VNVCAFIIRKRKYAVCLWHRKTNAAHQNKKKKNYVFDIHHATKVGPLQRDSLFAANVMRKYIDVFSTDCISLTDIQNFVILLLNPTVFFLLDNIICTISSLNCIICVRTYSFSL